MSHCTSFKFSYTDEALAVKAFKRLGLEPTTDVVCEYSSTFSKAILGTLGFAGTKQYRAIVAKAGEYQYFLVREGDEYRLLLERHGVLTERDQARMAKLEAEFREAYIRLAVERVADRLDNQGIRHEFEDASGGVLLRFGPMLAQSLQITFGYDGNIQEEISGFSGPGCVDFTAEIEGLLSVETAELATTWKPEYQQKVDSETLQVLRLKS